MSCVTRVWFHVQRAQARGALLFLAFLLSCSLLLNVFGSVLCNYLCRIEIGGGAYVCDMCTGYVRINGTVMTMITIDHSYIGGMVVVLLLMYFYVWQPYVVFTRVELQRLHNVMLSIDAIDRSQSQLSNDYLATRL